LPGSGGRSFGTVKAADDQNLIKLRRFLPSFHQDASASALSPLHWRRARRTGATLEGRYRLPMPQQSFITSGNLNMKKRSALLKLAICSVGLVWACAGNAEGINGAASMATVTIVQPFDAAPGNDPAEV